MTKARLYEILISYIHDDLDYFDTEVVRDKVEELCTTEEIKELGLYNDLKCDDDDEDEEDEYEEV